MPHSEALHWIQNFKVHRILSSMINSIYLMSLCIFKHRILILLNIKNNHFVLKLTAAAEVLFGKSELKYTFCTVKFEVLKAQCIFNG